MCLAIPGKIIEIKDNIVTVDYLGEKRKGNIVEGSYKKGDFIILQAGLVIEKVPKEQAGAWLKSIK